MFEGPETVPVQCNMSSSLTGAAEHVGRGSFWRFNHSCLRRLRVILVVVAVGDGDDGNGDGFRCSQWPGSLFGRCSVEVLSLTVCDCDSSVTPSSRLFLMGPDLLCLSCDLETHPSRGRYHKPRDDVSGGVLYTKLLP